ncbi:MAG: nucleotidyltransferase family protein [Clostridiales bacterium]|nr:nucleotidyltransferase family protein [Clostridiales bacterium]
MKTAGLITAAGQSLRMGAAKMLLPIDGKPMIARTADVFLRSGVTDLFVVVGREGDAVISALAETNARFLWNRDFETTDMFASIQIGLAAIRREGGFDGAFLLPGDMPAVPPDVLLRLMAEMETGHWDAVFPSTGTRRLHPPLVRADCFGAIVDYRGEDGLRGAFRSMDVRIGYVLTPEAGCDIDVDTPADYERVQRHLSARGKGGTAT